MKDADVLTVFRAIQDAYVDTIVNPFAETHAGELPGTHARDTLPAPPLNTERQSRTLTSSAFAQRISTIAGWLPVREA